MLLLRQNDMTTRHFGGRPTQTFWFEKPYNALRHTPFRAFWDGPGVSSYFNTSPTYLTPLPLFYCPRGIHSAPGGRIGSSPDHIVYSTRPGRNAVVGDERRLLICWLLPRCVRPGIIIIVVGSPCRLRALILFDATTFPQKVDIGLVRIILPINSFSPDVRGQGRFRRTTTGPVYPGASYIQEEQHSSPAESYISCGVAYRALHPAALSLQFWWTTHVCCSG